MKAASAYARSRGDIASRERVVLLMSSEDLEKLDGWGVPAGMPSRAEAIRTLIRKGLEVVTNDGA